MSEPEIDSFLADTLSVMDEVGLWTLTKSVQDNAERYTDKVFIESPIGDVSWKTFNENVNKIANGLNALDLRVGDHIGLYTSPSPYYLFAYFGALRAGLVCVPIGTRLKLDEVSYEINQSNCTAIIVSAEYAELAKACLPLCSSLRRIIECDLDSLHGGHLELNLMIDEGDPICSLPQPTVWDAAMILYTSGTTARPKGVMMKHGHLVQWALNVSKACGYRSEDRVLHFFPMYHGNGGVSLIMPVVLRGATLVLIEKFSASRFGEQAVVSKATVSALNASHVKMILNHPETKFDVRGSIDRIHYSLPLTPDERKTFAERFNSPQLMELYGLTEGMGVTMCTPLDGAAKPGSVGLVVPGYKVALVSASGQPVPQGQVGEIVISSLSRFGVADGYFGDPEATAQAFRSDGLWTGDTAYMDEDGYFWYVERSKDMIKRSGFNVAPSEVERVLRTVPGISDVSVVGIVDEIREQSVVAFVVVGEDSSEIIAKADNMCLEYLADYKIPEHYIAISELPVNHVGKVDKKILRAQATELLIGVSEERPTFTSFRSNG